MAQEANAKTPLIYLADDDEELTDYLGHLMSRHGYDVRTFGNAPALIEALGRDISRPRYKQPDAIVTDIYMPGMNGLRVVRSLRRSGWHIPIVVISAFGGPDIMTEVSQASVEFLRKPFDGEALLKVLKRQLDRRAVDDDESDPGITAQETNPGE